MLLDIDEGARDVVKRGTLIEICPTDLAKLRYK